jgi:RNA polymerase sigma factor for flagellar operon FliA
MMDGKMKHIINTGYYTEENDFPDKGLDPKKREELIVKYAPIIKYIATRIFSRLPSNIELEDLINAGIIGFMDALDRFDPKKNIKFKTYAVYRIRGAIMDELRSMDWFPRSFRDKVNLLGKTFHYLEQKHKRPAMDEEVASHLNMDLERYYDLISKISTLPLLYLEEMEGDLDSAYFHSNEDQDPFFNVWQKELTKIIARAIEILPEKERMVITLYYYEELNMKEIARVLGITESRVSQLHTKAMIRLKRILEKIA